MNDSKQLPRRVHVPFGKRPPKGVIWAAAAVPYHAARPHFNRSLGVACEQEPAKLDEIRQAVRDYVSRRNLSGEWWYYRGRTLACPFRCALDSKCCPVDVLIEEINRPSPTHASD
ncbi:MAG: hypothetical protein QM750_19945 [Rubrivivax sp.]